MSDDDRNLVRLFSNIVGGLFDVDRMDYLERDSKNAGIKYGLVETERLTKALVPMLTSEKKMCSSPDLSARPDWSMLWITFGLLI